MNEIFIDDKPLNQTNHPDNHWLIKTKGWRLAGTLSFANRLLDVQHRELKNLFALYNYHLDGEYNWKNVPVYWRWEYSENERLHCHFALMGYTPDFYWLRGTEHRFDNGAGVERWFTTNWKQGKSYFEGQKSEAWLKTPLA